MTHSTRPQSKAVAAGTAAGLRHLDRIYVAKVNAALAEGRVDRARELAHDYELTHAAELTRHPGDRTAGDPASCERQPQRMLRRPRWLGGR